MTRSKRTPKKKAPRKKAPKKTEQMNDDDFSAVEIRAGEEWLVVTCRQCGKSLLLEPVSPDLLDEDGVPALPAGNLEVEFPRCGNVSSYQSDEIRVEVGRQRH